MPWRIKVNVNSLWVNCIITFHNLIVCDGHPLAKKRLQRVWCTITLVMVDLTYDCVVLGDLFKTVLGRGENIRLWKDSWLLNMPLKSFFFLNYTRLR